MRPSEVSSVPKSELIWGFYHLAEDEKELVELIQSQVEFLIAAINPKLYEKIQEKKNAVTMESDFFDAELKQRGITKEIFDSVDNEDKPENYDEGIDVIGNPIQIKE